MSVEAPLGLGFLATSEARPDAGLASSPADFMSRDETASEKSELAGLTAHDDARALVRLIQCQQCSRPFRNPVTLPCGNSLCRQCLPAPHHRQGLLTWPDMTYRREAIRCPFKECGEEHAIADFAMDFALSKVMESVAGEVSKHTALANASAVQSPLTTTVEEIIRYDEGMTDTSEKPRSQTLPGPRLLATYTLAAEGKLDRGTDLRYQITPEEDDLRRPLDAALLRDLVESSHRDLDCQVCYRALYDPVTTACGHSFCRNCMTRVLDYAHYCPACRRSISIALTAAQMKTNTTLKNLLEGLCPESIAARAAAIREEEAGGEGELNVPLFVCTLAFPHQPSFLRIFEPRYRLMLRRCLEGNRQFGMLLPNRYLEPQGDLGPVRFFQYGTMLEIQQAQTLPDGTSLVESQGAYRIRVLATGEVDGYAIGKVERVEDVSPEEEQRLELEEISQPAPTNPDEEAQSGADAEEPNATNSPNATTTTTNSSPTDNNPPTGTTPDAFQAQIDRLSTEELWLRGRAFIERMQQRSAPWLQQRVLSVHGQPPDDAALFPYWFASVLPIAEEEKYKLLATRTVRERLKITAGWIQRIESSRW